MKAYYLIHLEQITQAFTQDADTFIMAAQNLLIMNLLRIITPEEIADIATKHNGGKFLSLTALVNERFERNIHRDFTNTNAIDQIHDEHALYSAQMESAKILPFNTAVKNLKPALIPLEKLPPVQPLLLKVNQKVVMKPTSQIVHHEEEVVVEKKEIIKHAENENMSSFILVEKERLKQSQTSLKKKEVIRLYQKNSNIDLEQIKTSNQGSVESSEAGVLVNKKQY